VDIAHCCAALGEPAISSINPGPELLSRYENTVHYSMMHGCIIIGRRPMRVIEKQGISKNSARFSRTTNAIGRDAYFIAGLIAPTFITVIVTQVH
jgi:hypothetical protein